MAAQKQAQRPDHKPTSKAFVALLLIAVLAGTITLVVLAKNMTSSSASGAEDYVPPALLTPAPTSEPTPEPEPAPEPEFFASPKMTRLLTAATDGHLLRAIVGGCGAEQVGAAEVEVSFDGGSGWQRSNLTDLGLRKVTNLDLSQTGYATASALNADCAAYEAFSFVAGSEWALSDAPTALWYLDQNNAALVHAPGATYELPCQAVALSAHGQSAMVLCDDSRVTMTTDLGASWSAPLEVARGVAVAATDSGFLLATASMTECVGVTVSTVTVSTATASGLAEATVGPASACYQAVDAADDSIFDVAISAYGSTIYLWHGNSFVRSNDNGVTWV